MEIRPVSKDGFLISREDQAGLPQSGQKGKNSVQAAEDLYDLDLAVSSRQVAVPLQGGSWPHDNCDTPPCNATGTLGPSCQGTCQGCS